MIQFVDTHAHLYAEQFESDRLQVMERAFQLGVGHIFLPNIDLASIEPMFQLVDQFPGRCFPMMGLHPCYVKADYKEVLQKMEAFLYKRTFCAIGEIGMDLYWDKSFQKEQEEAFYVQAEWAINRDLPIVIHSREATTELIRMIKNVNDSRLHGIFHCFGGSIAEAQQIIDLGFLLGIGGILTFKKSGLDKTLIDIPLENLVLETDSPYLAPTPYRGKRNESSYIPIIAQKLSELKEVPIEQVAKVTTENAWRVFNCENKAMTIEQQ